MGRAASVPRVCQAAGLRGSALRRGSGTGGGLRGPARRPGLQAIVPVDPLPFREVPDEAEVPPAGLGGDGVDLIGQGAPAGVVVGGDPGPRPHALDGRLDQCRLVRVHGPGGAGVAGLPVRVQGGIGEGVDATLGEHQVSIPDPGGAEKQAFLPALEKPVKWRFLIS
jgi:hypothetical protein